MLLAGFAADDFAGGLGGGGCRLRPMFSFVSFTNVLSWRGVSFWRVMGEALPDSPATSQPNIRLGLILKEPLWQAAVCALVAFAVYLRTLAPTVMWDDMGEFATAAC